MLKKWVLFLMGSFFSAALLAADIPTIHISTEDTAPYSFKGADGKIQGVSVDLLKLIFSKAKVNYTLTIDSWVHTYESALNITYHGAISTAETPERKSLFKWVGPLVTMQWVLLAKKGRYLSIDTLNDAKKYMIGGYRDDAITDYLKSKGFKNIRISENNSDNVSLLENEEIDIWATPEDIGYLQAKNLGVNDFKTVYYIKSIDYSLALNKSIPDEIVKQLSNALAEIRK